MKVDLSDIGFAGFIICLGVAYVIEAESKARRIEDCEKRGGHFVVVKENTFIDDKTCNLNIKEVSK